MVLEIALVLLGLSVLCTVVSVAALAFANRPSDRCWTPHVRDDARRLDPLDA